MEAKERNMKLERYVEALNKCANGYQTYSIKAGRKWIKIMTSHSKHYPHAFVDLDGNIYKPASYDQPYPKVRYHLDDIEWLEKNVDQFGSYLYAQ